MRHVNGLPAVKALATKANEPANDESCFNVILDFSWISRIFFFNAPTFSTGVKIDVLSEALHKLQKTL